MVSGVEQRAIDATGQTDGERLRLLADDPSPHVRAAVAGNHSTPPDVLRRLAAENAREPARAVAALAAADAAIAEIVLIDGSPRAREHLAELAAGITAADRRWFADALTQLEGVPGGWRVRLAVDRERRDRRPLPIETQWRLVDDPVWQVRASLARMTAEPAVLERLTRDDHERSRVACIENSRVTAEQVDRLLHDRQRNVRAWVAGAAALTLEQMLDVAAEESSEDVLDMLIHRLDVPRAVLERLIARGRSEYLSSFAQQAVDHRP